MTHLTPPLLQDLRWAQGWEQQLSQGARTQLLSLGGNLPRKALWGNGNLFPHLLLLHLPQTSHTQTHTHTTENPLRRQRVRVKKYKKAHVHQSPDRALNWEFQVENGYHFTTLNLLASEWTTLSSLRKC